MAVRKANRNDIPALLALTKRHHAEHDFAWPFDPVRLSMTLAHAIEATDWLCLIGDGALLLAQAFDSPLGAGRLAVEHIVRAAQPGQFAAMLQDYECWARRQGCASMSIGCVRKPRVFARLYGRHGFRPSESTFVKAL